jgi:rhodanese-related sulfurtransferase
MAAAKPFILDVRETSEVTKTGKIEGAVNIPVRTLPANLDKLPTDKAAPIVVYCAIGHRRLADVQSLRRTRKAHLLGDDREHTQQVQFPRYNLSL